MKMLYKYPQGEFPYGWLVEENRRRGGSGPEFELIDTGIFDDDRYFDIFIEYAQGRVRTTSRFASRFTTAVRRMPTFGFCRIYGSAIRGRGQILPAPSQPLNCRIQRQMAFPSAPTIITSGRRQESARRLATGPALPLRAGRRGAALHQQRNQRHARLAAIGRRSRSPYVKDAFHRYIVNGEARAVNPRRGRHQGLSLLTNSMSRPAEATSCPCASPRSKWMHPLADVDEHHPGRARQDADEFYDSVHPPKRDGRRAHDPASGLRGTALDEADLHTST